jgi:hypothetical protein
LTVFGVFVDFLNMTQTHDCNLPVLNDGHVIAIGQDGEVEYETHRSLDTEGSFATSLRIRCDGQRVDVSGNIGRFNRPDNVFGLNYEACVDKWNTVISGLGLPPFTRGIPMIRRRGNDENRMVEFTGAINTRIDLTKNFSLGSPEALRLYMAHLGRQQLSRTKSGTRVRDESITWGEGSRYVYEILYEKARELSRHNRPISEHVTRLIEWCDREGIARYEVKLKTRFLSQQLLRFLGETNHARLCEVFAMRQEKLFGGDIPWDSINDIPKPYRFTVKDWRDGVDLEASMSRRTFYRHRSEILKSYGIDISTPAPKAEEAMQWITPIKVEIKDAVEPDWYAEASREIKLAA